jgi:hypothetical protein
MNTKFVGWALAHRGNSKFRGNSIVATLMIALLILFALLFLIPKINPPLRPAHPVKQRAQLHAIDAAIELFNSNSNGYPPSGAVDENGKPYCGAMKLCEAMMGRDLMGFNPESVFRSDGMDGNGNVLYPKWNPKSEEAYQDSLITRKGPYLPLENANAYTLADIYGKGNIGSFDPNNHVFCGTFENIKISGKRKKVGMPILYYKADTSKTAHDVNDPNNPENIYDYRDNHALLALGVPGKPGQKHPLYEDPKIFYEVTRNDKITGPSRPYRADTYILLSAGYDGLYGTEDDIANFEFRRRPK